MRLLQNGKGGEAFITKHVVGSVDVRHSLQLDADHMLSGDFRFVLIVVLPDVQIAAGFLLQS